MEGSACPKNRGFLLIGGIESKQSHITDEKNGFVMPSNPFGPK
jgi:hypothetical protein